MKSIRVTLPDSEYSFFLEFLKHLKNTKVVVEPALKEEEVDVPEWQKKIVLDRVKSATAKSFKPWSKVKKAIKHKN